MNAFEDELGAQPPLGFYDPFGMLNGDVSQERFTASGTSRSSTAASVSWPSSARSPPVAASTFHNINYSGNSFDSFSNGVVALIGQDSIPTAGFVQLVAFIGVLECTFIRDVEGTSNKFVGNFRNGYIDFGWDNFDKETKLSKRTIELNNGRATMMGILSLVVHERIAPH